MTNSGVRSKFKMGRKAALALTVLILAAILWGPGLALKAALAYARHTAGEQGFDFSYEGAKAAPLFNSADIRGLRLQGPGEAAAPRCSVELLRLEQPSVINLIRLALNPEFFRAQSAGLARGLRLENLEFAFSGLSGRLESLAMISPSLSANQAKALKFPPARDDGDVAAKRGALALTPPTLADSGDFESVNLKNLVFHSSQSGESLELGRLGAKKSGAELIFLNIENLAAEGGPARNSPRLELGAMTAGGVDIAALEKMFSSKENFINILNFCDSLDLVHGSFSINGQNLLHLRQAVFDVNETGGELVYQRGLKIYADLPALAALDGGLAGEPAFMALTEASGGSLEMDLTLNLAYRPDGGEVDFRDFTIESPGLGRLKLGGRFLGITGIRPGFTPYQLLFTSAGGLLEKISLSFSDRGFMPAFYRALDKTVFSRSPSRQSAVNLMDYYVQPLADSLEGENGLANLTAVLSEVRAFLGRPESLAINCAPSAPLPLLSLANPDKYDIINRLSLSVQVNQRAPVTVRAAEGVNHERLPSAPRHLENSFSEENIKF